MDTCPRCGHERDAKVRRTNSWWRRLFGLAPTAACCLESEIGPAGWPEPCMCEHGFHGS